MENNWEELLNEMFIGGKIETSTVNDSTCKYLVNLQGMEVEIFLDIANKCNQRLLEKTNLKISDTRFFKYKGNWYAVISLTTD